MNFMSPIPGINPYLVMALLIWSMFWKSLALWRAAKGNQRYWFVGLLLINSFGILELVYLFRFAKNRLTVEEIKQKKFLP